MAEPASVHDLPAEREIDELLVDPSIYDDPYPAYARLRDESPAHWDAAVGQWLITRYDDVHDVFRDTRRFSSFGWQVRYFERVPDAVRIRVPTLEQRGATPNLVTSDPPAHTRVRRMLQAAFTPKAVEALRGRVEALVHDLLDEAERHGELDLVEDLAFPLPASMIADLLGARREDRESFRLWAQQVMAFMSRASPATELTPEIADAAETALTDLYAYWRTIIAERRREPRDDIVTAIVSPDRDGDVLGEQEILGNFALFLTAGHETTTGLIGNGLLALLQHPEQLAAIRREPALLDVAIDEMLRFEAPVQRLRRTVREDVELHGRHLRQGEPVELIVAAANRDARRFERPDEFDIHRDPSAQLAFGKGVHRCLGASLARLEASVAIGEVLRRYPGLRLRDGARPAWLRSTVLRNLTALPVAA